MRLSFSNKTPRSIVQIGRSSFISSALEGVAADMYIYSSASFSSRKNFSGDDGIFVIVPPKIPSPEAREVFERIFLELSCNARDNTCIVLISSLVCSIKGSLNPRYAAYRDEKAFLELRFKHYFNEGLQKGSARIIRLGMFAPCKFPSKGHGILALAYLFRPFMPLDREFRYTDKAALKAAVICAFHSRSSEYVGGSIKIKGSAKLPMPSFLAPIAGKLFLTFDGDVA